MLKPKIALLPVIMLCSACATNAPPVRTSWEITDGGFTKERARIYKEDRAFKTASKIVTAVALVGAGVVFSLPAPVVAASAP